MSKYVKRTQKDYSLSLKLQLVKEVESGTVETPAWIYEVSYKHENGRMVPKIKMTSRRTGEVVKEDASMKFVAQLEEEVIKPLLLVKGN